MIAVRLQQPQQPPTLQTVPHLAISDTIVALQEHFERLRQGEIARFRRRLGSLSADQKDVLESLTRGIVNEILRAPITALNAAAPNQDPTALVVVTRRAFGLGESARQDLTGTY